MQDLRACASMFPRRPAWMAFILSLVIPIHVSAQVTGATLSGTVADPSGSVIPNALVSIRNIATSITHDLSTDDAGFYAAPNLLPGQYELTISAPGFATKVRTNITLTIGEEQILNVTLQIGTADQKIIVSGEAPNVELATSSISAVVNSTTVRELPLNGRSWTDLATLQPGVNAIQTQLPFTSGSDRGTKGFGAQLSISGARPQQNNYRLDGISINDWTNGAPGSVLGGNLGVDAIQEFSLLTSNYAAEYGRTSGGVVNAITRSGTNQFHGNVYEFLRNSALDARNFFDSNRIPPFKRNQFGASAGMPIRKDKTFIFGDYEAIRQSKGITVTDTVPSPAARAGNLSTGTVAVDPSAAKYLGFYPLPNGPLLGNGDVGIFKFAAGQVVTENFVTTRIDHVISVNDSVYGTYLYDDTNYHSPDALDVVLVGSHTKRQVIALEENHNFNLTFMNTVRAGFSREAESNYSTVSAINPLGADLSLGADPGRAAGEVDISGVSKLLGGLGSGSPNFWHWNSFQGYDDAFLTRGTHSIKFGFALERMQLNSESEPLLNGRFVFPNLSAFLTNRPSLFTGSFPNTVTPRGVRQLLLAGYIQDDWRARPNLTLNLGLRYEMTTVPTEVHNKISNLINITDAVPHLGNPFFLNPTLRNFEPRIGFAWDPFRNGKSSIRGGFGIFDVLPLPYLSAFKLGVSEPFFSTGSVNHLPEGSFFAGAFPLLVPATRQQLLFEYKPKRNYVMQWNLNVQRELSPNLTTTVAYVGSRGVHMPFPPDDANIVVPKLTSAGYLFPSPVGSGTKINPNFGLLRSLFWEGNSYYDALEVGIQKRMAHGFQAQGSFTWGKAIDTDSASLLGDQFSNSIASWWNWFNPKVSRALTGFQHRPQSRS